MNLPILTSLVALPFIGGVAVLLTGRNRPALARWLALGHIAWPPSWSAW